MRITYHELVMEDGEEMVTAAEEEAVQPAFDTPVKHYRIMEGMGVTYHCKMTGNPLPKVLSISKLIITIVLSSTIVKNKLHKKYILDINQSYFSAFLFERLHGTKMESVSTMAAVTRWRFSRMVEPVYVSLWCCLKMRVFTLHLPAT